MPALALSTILARAGGGHGFSGGGGGGGHSFGGGGGGGGGVFFFGGGGGGGGGGGIIGFIFLIVIVLIVLALFAAYRRSRTAVMDSPGGSGVGGPGGAPGGSTPSWTGSQQPAINSVRGELFPGSDQQAHPGATSADEGVAQIQVHDPAFNTEVFLETVQRAFFVVQEAWTDRKPDMSRQVMADGLWQQHKVQIEQYIAEHKRNVLEDLAVGDLTVLSAHSDATYDTITVRVLAACADYDVNDESGKVVRGNRRVGNWQEDWTFQRSSKAVTKPGGGTLSAKCPNCGAPLDVDLQGVCKYCHAPIMSGDYDWVLARIGQVL
jgi:predicted lipid-binding transport protein (Tim44 family)